MARAEAATVSIADGAGATAHLAARMLALRWEDLPPQAAIVAGHCLLDWLGVTIAGWRAAPVEMLLAEAEAEGGNALATLIGSGGRTSLQQAALINGTASHVLDFDDVHLASRVHPSVPVIPAALAAAERQGATGRDFILGFLAGVETQSRIAAVMGAGHYRAGWHSTATLGSFGATMAAARLFGLNPGQASHALGIAATQAAGLRAVFGTSCKPLHAGHAAATGILAARLAQRGFDSRTDILEAADGFAALQGGGDLDWPALTAPAPLAALSIIFKYHASCYGTHGAIEAALRLREQLAGATSEFDRIEVRVEPQYLSVCNIPEPATDLQAKFSLRHTVALALAGRDTMAPESFAAAARNDPAIQRLRQAVTVVGDPALPRANCRIAAHSGGQAVTANADVSAAETDLDRQGARLAQKFHALAAPLIGAEAAGRIVALCAGLDRLDDLAGLLALCRLRDGTPAPAAAA